MWELTQVEAFSFRDAKLGKLEFEEMGDIATAKYRKPLSNLTSNYIKQVIVAAILIKKKT